MPIQRKHRMTRHQTLDHGTVCHGQHHCRTNSNDDEKPDSQVLEEMTDWMTNKLPCIAGRREYGRGRYMVRMGSKPSVPLILAEYEARLQRNEAVACLMVFNDPRFYENMSDTSRAFLFLAEQMELISHACAEQLADGASLSKTITLRCPVTNQTTPFDDFECIAFCPQSAVRSDPLYDPPMYAPYPCVNVSSDVYAFSRFVADSALAAWGHSVFDQSDLGRISRLFSICIDRWHRIATATINNFASATDTSLCPIHVTNDNRHWMAAHKDPAFAEQTKETHCHELPAIYARRIADRWLEFFANRGEYCATGISRDGIRFDS